MAKQSKKKKEKPCLLVAWGPGKMTLRDGVSVCPQCGKPAEMALSFIGTPCWAHKIKESR